MEKEFLTNYGLSDEEATKIIEKAEAENQQLSTELDTLKQQLSDKEAELTEVRANSAKYETDINDLKTTTAIKLALSGNVEDIDIVTGLIDRSKLKLADDGTLEGLDEQVQSLRESKSFLFKSEQSKGFTKVGAGADDGTEQKSQGFREAIEAAIAPNFN